MRFDDFVRENKVPVTPVDQFTGLVVEVGAASDWEPFDSAPGFRAWLGPSDSRSETFCANAVLTMHTVHSALNADDAFSMLSEQQASTVPACREVHREVAVSTEGAGIVGRLVLEIAHQLGTIESVSTSRIIVTEQQTQIAQLTVTTLGASPADKSGIWLTVRTHGDR